MKKYGFSLCCLLGAGLLLVTCKAAEDDDNKGGNADSGAGDGGAADGEDGGGPDGDTDGDKDADGGDSSDNYDDDDDGFTIAEGDCDDDEAFVNPDAVEDLGENGKGDDVDNDCDGLTDETEDCDCPEVGAAAKGLAAAINLCDERFLLDQEKIKSSSGGDVAFDTVFALGNNDCLFAHEGCEMAVLSTGPVGQLNPNMATSMGGVALLVNDPKPEFQGDTPTGGVKNLSCDLTVLSLDLKSPANAKGFSFDFLFGSAEYDEWILQNYNDTFYAIMISSDLNNGATTNIAFDTMGSEIEVDANFFENKQHPCDESGSGWQPGIPSKSGSTGWLRTSWNVAPGHTFKLAFSIHDEGDCIYDSIAMIDNFRWHTEPVEPGTKPVIE